MSVKSANFEPKPYREFFSEPMAVLSGEPDWLAQARQKSWQRAQHLGLPSRKHEGWKYTNLENLLNAAYLPTRTDLCGFVALNDLEKYFFTQKEALRLVFFNGRFCKGFSNEQKQMIPPGVVIASFSELGTALPAWVKDQVIAESGQEKDSFQAMANAHFHEGLVIYVPKDVSIPVPVQLIFAGGAETTEYPSVFYPRIFVMMEPGSRADIVVESVGVRNEPYFSNAVFNLSLAENAKLQWSIVRKQSERSHQFYFTKARLKASSHLDLITFAQDSGVVRDDIEVDLMGQDAFCSTSGLSLLSHSSLCFQHAKMNHRVPHCRSRQLFKNIVAGKSQAECDSEVHVFRDAQKSDSHQLNRNLLLSETARAYSRPQLKIDADDVQCAHGSATGQLEEDEIFYLQSRGIKKELAKFILTFGFAEEVLQEIHLAPLRHKLELAVRAKLESLVQT